MSSELPLKNKTPDGPVETGTTSPLPQLGENLQVSKSSEIAPPEIIFSNEEPEPTSSESESEAVPEMPEYWPLFLAKISSATLKLSRKHQQMMKGNDIFVVQNRYLLLQKLGKGGFGFIYSGVDMTTGLEVAIKLVLSKILFPINS